MCDYVDETLFPGFKSTGSASSSCDESPEERLLEAPRGGVGYAAASYSTRSGSSSGSSSGSYSTRSATRPGGPARTSTTRAVRGASYSSSSSSTSTSSAGSSSASRSSAGSASGSGSSSSEVGSRATPRSVRRRDRHDHESHHDTDAWMIAAALPEGFQTPFDQTAALKEGKGIACYTQCRADCAEHHGKLLDTEPGYISGQDTTFESSTSSSSSRADVECAVSFADVLQYAGAASVEVTGGPKLLRHVKVRVAPSGIEPSTAEHPTAGRAPFHAPVVLCFPLRRRMRSRFLPARLTM